MLSWDDYEDTPASNTADQAGTGRSSRCCLGLVGLRSIKYYDGTCWKLKQKYATASPRWLVDAASWIDQAQSLPIYWPNSPPHGRKSSSATSKKQKEHLNAVSSGTDTAQFAAQKEQQHRRRRRWTLI